MSTFRQCTERLQKSLADQQTQQELVSAFESEMEEKRREGKKLSKNELHMIESICIYRADSGLEENAKNSPAESHFLLTVGS